MEFYFKPLSTTRRRANYPCLRAKRIQLQLKKAKDLMVCGPSMEVQIYLTLLPFNHMGNYAIATFAIIGSGHTFLADGKNSQEI